MTSIWLQGEKEYTAEMSELTQGGTEHNFACPKCYAEISISESEPVRDREDEITHFIVKCLCGARLTIFND